MFMLPTMPTTFEQLADVHKANMERSANSGGTTAKHRKAA